MIRDPVLGADDQNRILRTTDRSVRVMLKAKSRPSPRRTDKGFIISTKIRSSSREL